MTDALASTAARVVLVGEDAEVGSALLLHLSHAGWAPFCVPCPELLEALLPSIVPHAIVLVLPASPAATWGAAVTAAATAARAGVRVVVVAPSREIVEPLAAVAGAERAVSRAEVLAQPLSILEHTTAGHAPPPLRPPAGRAPPPARTGIGPGPTTAPGTATTGPVTLTPVTLTPTTPGPAVPLPSAAAVAAQQARPGRPSVDLMALIDEEIGERALRQPATRVDVNVSLVSEHNFYVGATKRLDSGGVFISTMLPPPVGTLLEVRLGLPDGRKLQVQGEVAFVRDRSTVTGRQPPGCGVRLMNVPGWALEAIDRFLAARPPILHTRA